MKHSEGDTGGSFELNVVVEFGAVVGGNGFEALRVPTNEPQGPPVRVLFGSGSELADKDATGFAFSARVTVNSERRPA